MSPPVREGATTPWVIPKGGLWAFGPVPLQASPDQRVVLSSMQLLMNSMEPPIPSLATVSPWAVLFSLFVAIRALC